jgi:hypothetical protein
MMHFAIASNPEYGQLDVGYALVHTAFMSLNIAVLQANSSDLHVW